MGWSVNPDVGVTGGDGTFTFPQNTTTQNIVYTVTYTDGNKECSKTVTVKGISSSECCNKITVTPTTNKIPQEGVEGGNVVVATFTSECPSSLISVQCSDITRIEPNGNNIVVIDCERNDGPEATYTANLLFNGEPCKTFNVVQKGNLTVKISSDKTMLDGSTQEQFTVYYWAEDSNHNIVSDGVVLTEVEVEASNKINYEFERTGTTSDGKLFKVYNALENNVNRIKSAKFKAVLGEKESTVLEIEQSGQDMTILPDFDYLTFTFTWTDEDGHDLDTATYVEGSNLPIVDRTLDDCPVGYGLVGSNNPTISAVTSMYLQHGGDNTQSGDECALVNWKKICDHDYISEGITKLYCNLYANWYGAKDSPNGKRNGNCTVTYKTYKGDGMQHGDGTNRFIFVPSGNTELVSTIINSGNVYAYSTANANKSAADTKIYYSYVAKLTYDIQSKSAILENKMTSRTGREVRGYMKIDGVTYECNNGGEIKEEEITIESAAYNNSMIIEDVYNTINGVRENLVLTGSCKAYNCASTQITNDFCTVTVDSSLNKVSWSLTQNTTGVCREADVIVKGTSGTRNVEYKIYIKQNPS